VYIHITMKNFQEKKKEPLIQIRIQQFQT